MTETPNSKLGIIAGGGQLPGLLVAACKASQRAYSLIGITGAADVTSLGEEPTIWMRLGEAAKGFAHLSTADVTDIVVAGKVNRPTLSELMPDWRTAKFLARVGTRAFVQRDALGDDGLLRAVIAEIETEGFNVVSVDSLLPDLVVEAGEIGNIALADQDRSDISIGFLAAKELGRRDVGQAVVVRDGEVVGKEGLSGTDSLINDASVKGDDRAGPILVKVMKPEQDRRADLPAIGPETISKCAEAGFRGVAIEARNTLVIDKQAVAAKADEHGLFVVAVDAPADAPPSGT